MLSKRLFDIAFSLLGLLLLAPILTMVSLAIALDSGSPILFRQERVGRRGRPFRIHKFRTMIVGAARHGPPITVGDDKRITRVGTFLRRFKLDELPQLIDVLVGDMSVVGPRPELARYVAAYPAEAREIVLAVRPGITDFASIEFRNESELLGRATDPEKAYLELILPIKLQRSVDYCRNRTFLMDLHIIWKTVNALWVWRG